MVLVTTKSLIGLLSLAFAASAFQPSSRVQFVPSTSTDFLTCTRETPFSASSLLLSHSDLCTEKVDGFEMDGSTTGWILPLLTWVFTFVFIFPHVAGAVDHPSEYTGLGIPIPIPDARYFISGGVCAAASHGITVPVDVVKTRIQANPRQYSDGFLASTRQIIKREGIATLASGWAPTVLGYGFEGAAKFGLYESLKPTFASILQTDDLGYLCASVVAGAAASLLLCPLEQTRIRMVTDESFAGIGLFAALGRLVQQEGVVPTVLGGFPAMLSKQVPYTFGKQVSFDIFAVMLYHTAASMNFSAVDIKLEVSVLAAFCASIVACLLSHPGDVILTDTYKGEGREKGELPALKDVVSGLWEDQGIQGFFSGLTARLFHVGAVITSQLILYDLVKQLLGLPATGST